MFPAHAARALALMPDDFASHLLRRIGARSTTAVLRHLPTARRTTLIKRLPLTMATAVRLMLRHPEDSVGALTDVEILALPEKTTAREALARLRASTDDAGDFVYIVDSELRLIGCLRPATLLRAPSSSSMGELAQRGIPRLSAHAKAESVRDHHGWSAYSTLPVVAPGGRLMGALRREALMRSATPTSQSSPMEPAASVIESFVCAYWFALSGLVATAVNWLPVRNPAGDKP
jgi:Mg/Co/Ni transporter MgtE